MKSRICTLALAGFAIVGFLSAASSAELVYQPVNPTFGGDPLNGNWLLSQATAQSEGGGSPGFTIDFPDFGGIPQEPPTPEPLPDVD